MEESAPLPTSLPVYLEDSHAGSFYFLAEELNLDTPHILLLIDDHSDASGIIDSDSIRGALRRVASKDTLLQALSAWRKSGAVQCFDWIEPLMPRPFGKVLWVPGPDLSPKSRASKEREAREELDGHQEAAPRSCGNLAAHYSVASLGQLPAALEKLPPDWPIVASVDLDYFVNFPAARQQGEVRATLAKILALRRLRALTFCISRPWLANDEEAARLAGTALEEVLRLNNVRLRLAPFADTGPDRSRKAEAFAAAGKPAPRFGFDAFGPPTRTLLLAHRERIEVKDDAERWQQMLDSWAAEAGGWRIQIDGFQAGADGIFRFPSGTRPALRVASCGADQPAIAVRWFAWLPESLICNVLPGWAGKGFADGATPRILRNEKLIGESDPALPAPWEKFSPLLDRATGWGGIEVQAEVRTSAGTSRTPRTLLRFHGYEGFRAAVTEQFGQPYVFGSTWLTDGLRTGPETGWGSDCVNFVVAGLRRQGLRIGWGNPEQIKDSLTLVAASATVDSATRLEAGWLERGVIIHLGSHVAALLEDRPPQGILDGGDLVAHHLEDAPRALTLAKFLQGRAEDFAVWRAPDPPRVSRRILVGGDVMLGRGIGERIRKGANPLSGIQDFLCAADFAVVNLECAVTNKGKDEPKPFCFRAPSEAVNVLKECGIDAVSLANNHAGDAGQAGRADMAQRLGRAGIRIACSPDDPDLCLADFGQWKVAFLGVNFIQPSIPDKLALERLLHRCRAAARCTVVLPHWGEEYSGAVTDFQREWAQWFVAHGADAVIGSHPHHRQFPDVIAGRPVIFSLGNLVFDEGGSDAEFRTGWVAEIGLTDSGSLAHVRAVPVRLSEQGEPEMVESGAAVRRK